MSQRSVRPASARALPRLAVGSACCTLVLVTLAGCGSDGGESDDPGTASDTSSSATSSPESPTSDSAAASGGQFVIGETVEPGQAVIVTASNVDGDTSTLASALVSDSALDTFLATMEARLAEDVRAAVTATEVPAHSTLFGAVVAVGCDKPTAIAWSTTFEGVEVTPTMPKSGVQCLVPVTSVALFLVPN